MIEMDKGAGDYEGKYVSYFEPCEICGCLEFVIDDKNPGKFD